MCRGQRAGRDLLAVRRHDPLLLGLAEQVRIRGGQRRRPRQCVARLGDEATCLLLARDL
jgi:hypothetical protein